MSRVAKATRDSPNAVPALKSAIRSYRSSESNARALIATFFTVLNQDLDTTGTFISSLVDLLDDEEKKSGLLTTWKTYRLEHQQEFPSLTPGGQNYAGITSGRAIQVKRLQSGPGGRTRVWDRVAQAASSAPGPLPVKRTTRTTVTPSTVGKISSNVTPWSPSAVVELSSSQPRSTRSGNARPPAPSSSAFPSLPPSRTTRPPKEWISGQSSLRAIVGSASTNAWSPEDHPSPTLDDDSQDSMQPSRKKKVAKQTLFTLGSYR
jgi:E3 ubiquitin-protein ligase ZNF598